MLTFVWFSWTGTSPLHSRASYFIPGLKIPDSKSEFGAPLVFRSPWLCVFIANGGVHFCPSFVFHTRIEDTLFQSEFNILLVLRGRWLCMFITNGGVRFLTKFACCVCFVGNLHFNFCECYFFFQLTAQIVSFFVHFIQECNVLFQEFEQSSLGEAALSYILCAFYNTS